MILAQQRQFEKWVLTDEGSEVIREGSHEARVYGAVDSKTGSLQSDIMVRLTMMMSSLYNVLGM